MDVINNGVFAAFPNHVDENGRISDLEKFIGHDVVVVVLEEYASSFAPIPIGTRVV